MDLRSTERPPRMAQTTHLSPARPRRSDLSDRLVRYVLVPMVFVIGLYGLVRFVATGNGATADAYPSLEQRHLSAR
ncbi:MAG: hypothetical protein IPG69_03515 [Flavobacteriales bacterium]|nr:hypothetical protein [Flavobacteriales bacterium]